MAVVTGGSSLPVIAKIGLGVAYGLSGTIGKAQINKEEVTAIDLISGGVGGGTSMAFTVAVGDAVVKTGLQKGALSVGIVASQSDLISAMVSKGLKAMSEAESEAPTTESKGLFTETEYYMQPPDKLNREVGGSKRD
ncbi:hypothetical protein KAU34_01165 [candidate division WOR-3 bacterium]|nr:hypothetical protein [candidate division WOR-3 bacterium]